VNICLGFPSGPTPDQVELKHIQALLDQGTFWAQGRDLASLHQALMRSDAVVTAWDGSLLVGLARALSDGVYRATIWDVVVLPEYRGRGLGKTLVETLLKTPALTNVERVYLMTTHCQAFYEHLGFQTNTTTTMILTRER